jgi:NADH-quinone oxidoreductase subunit H
MALIHLYVLFSIEYYYSFLDFLFHILLTLLPVLIIVSLFTLAERKIMSSIQRRQGPTVVGLWGFLQPFADGLKLVVKEILIPTKANSFFFIFGPGLTLFLSFVGWVVIAFDTYTKIFNLNNSLLLILVVSSFGLHGILLSGWASNSKYALMGALRSVSQMISYEITISLILMPVILLGGSLNLNMLISKQNETCWFIFPLLPLAFIFFISMLAETNRAPFDLPEAESELVAGYNVEYSAIAFAAFFLAEYANILLMSTLFVIFFLGGGSSEMYVLKISIFKNYLLFSSLLQEFFFSLKIIGVTFLFVFIRANLPRFRFDQLLYIS